VRAVGLLDAIKDRLLAASPGAKEAEGTTGKAPWGGRAPDAAGYGKAGAPTPDLGALVTDAEIAAITGSTVEGEPRRNGPDGSDTDLGRHVIREAELANGDKFLIALGNCYDADAATLSMERVAEVEKPLDGVGERGLMRVERYPKKGTSEIKVTAMTGNFTLSLVHTSAEGKTDPEPLIAQLKQSITRL
jgi:hypothetical protein